MPRMIEYAYQQDAIRDAARTAVRPITATRLGRWSRWWVFTDAVGLGLGRAHLLEMTVKDLLADLNQED